MSSAHQTASENCRSALGRAMRVALRACLVVMGLWLAAGVALRWDRIHSLHDPRWQLMLTFVGVAVGTWLGGILVRGSPAFPRLAVVSLLTIVVSQTCYLSLVWTSWKTHPLLWRFWWLSMIVAANSTHIIWLRMAAPPDRRTLARVTVGCAMVTSVLLAILGLRSRLLGDVSPMYVWATLIPAALSTAGSIALWLRGIRLSPMRRVPRPVKIGWFCVLQAVLVSAAFYAGRITAPPPLLFEAIPSVLAHLEPQELESQVRDDLGRLEIIAAGVGDLIAKASAAYDEIRRQRADEQRDYFTPAEDDRLRSHFMSFLAYRAALLRLVAVYAGFESVPDPDARARCMLVGYAAAVTVFDADLRMIRLYCDDVAARRKLNEADRASGIPAGMFDRIRESVLDGRNSQALAEMEAHFEAHRDEWITAAVLPDDEFARLQSVIDRSRPLVRAGVVERSARMLDQIAARVREDSYTPVYAAQSMVSMWIGDTRLAQWESLIRPEQIIEIENQLQPGDILLERRNWFLSNAFLPGFWPHAALYVGRTEDLERLGLVRREDGQWTSDHAVIREHLTRYLERAADGQDHTVIESVSEGVILNSLTESMHADYVAALRPRLTETQKVEAILKAFGHLGKPYDFEFDFFSADKLVCTELVYRIYEGLIHFDLVEVMGRDTLPALEIARKFAVERGAPTRELDFVLFLDRVPGEHRVASADEAAFRASIDRPREFNE